MPSPSRPYRRSTSNVSLSHSPPPQRVHASTHAQPPPPSPVAADCAMTAPPVSGRGARHAAPAARPVPLSKCTAATNDPAIVPLPATAAVAAQSPLSITHALLAAAYYVATSVLLTVFNKLLFASRASCDPQFLLLCQSLTSALLLLLLRATHGLQLPSPKAWISSRANLRTYLPLFLANLTMLLSSLLALKFTSLLMYNTLRRTSMLFVVLIHSHVTRERPTAFTLLATALVTVGALHASRTDLAFDPLGYALALAANISTSFYLVLVRPVRDALRLSNIQLVFVNSIVNIPVLAVIISFFPPSAAFLQQFYELRFGVLFLCSCAFAVAINHSIFVNTTTNGAISQSIASQIKDVVLLVVSIWKVDDPAQRAKGNLAGALIGFLGSLTYGVGKLRERFSNSQTHFATEEKRSDADSTVRLVPEKQPSQSR